MKVRSLSIVLLAYNEEEAVRDAINDIHAFCGKQLLDYEIVVINDGSRDGTARVLEEIRSNRDQIITHQTNLGMGASIKDGFRAASKEYISWLPADRQVRCESLSEFLPHANPTTVVVSQYLNPPSGFLRNCVSWIFRVILKFIGGLSVDFAGSYLFHRDLFKKVDLKKIKSDSFVFSFELLEQFKDLGANFYQVRIPSYPRETGQSAEFLMKRIWLVFREILKVRLGF